MTPTLETPAATPKATQTRIHWSRPIRETFCNVVFEETEKDTALKPLDALRRAMRTLPESAWRPIKTMVAFPWLKQGLDDRSEIVDRVLDQLELTPALNNMEALDAIRDRLSLPLRAWLQGQEDVANWLNVGVEEREKRRLRGRTKVGWKPSAAAAVAAAAPLPEPPREPPPADDATLAAAVTQANATWPALEAAPARAVAPEASFLASTAVAAQAGAAGVVVRPAGSRPPRTAARAAPPARSPGTLDAALLSALEGEQPDALLVGLVAALVRQGQPGWREVKAIHGLINRLSHESLARLERLERALGTAAPAATAAATPPLRILVLGLAADLSRNDYMAQRGEILARVRDKPAEVTIPDPSTTPNPRDVAAQDVVVVVEKTMPRWKETLKAAGFPVGHIVTVGGASDVNAVAARVLNVIDRRKNLYRKRGDGQ